MDLQALLSALRAALELIVTLTQVLRDRTVRRAYRRIRQWVHTKWLAACNALERLAGYPPGWL